MDKAELLEFSDLLIRVGVTYGREMSPGAVSIYAAALSGYPFAAIKAAIEAHIRDPEAGRFMPMPAHLIGKIQATDGRPTAEEAWAMCPRSEEESLFWTEEMAQAYGVAAPLLGHGDQVAARKAFIDRYEGLVATARVAGVPMKVTPSFGFDRAGREAAVQRAVERGLLPAAKAQVYLLLTEADAPSLGYEPKRLQ